MVERERPLSLLDCFVLTLVRKKKGPRVVSEMDYSGPSERAQAL